MEMGLLMISLLFKGFLQAGGTGSVLTVGERANQQKMMCQWQL
jgi:hypothetical protein